MTTGRGEESSLPAGGPARHIPVLLADVLEALAPKPGGVYLDGTFGAGGYARALLAIPDVRVVALDRDPDAIAGGQALVAQAHGRLTLVNARFGALDEAARAAGFPALDGVTLDVGVSSMQIDEAARGFSFRFDGPLDMRMEQAGRSAADIVNGAPEEEIADILYYYGEERQARRIARAIVADREARPFLTTRQLAGLCERVAPAKPTQIHAATRTFQALRIAVNDELAELTRALAAAERALAPGGALAIVSFHSLEDRIVKQFFAERSGRGRAASRLLPGEPVPPASTFDHASAPVAPSSQEASANPRARSAKLRVARRTQAPALGLAGEWAKLARLPVREGQSGRKGARSEPRGGGR
jgi:16S rRNA (cytosine1402-N4)-methyltransferase